jgi:hypothetical protein
MSFHVDLDYVTIDKECYNLSFIILKNPKSPNTWTQFFRHTPWNTDVPVPQSFFQLDLETQGLHVYHPCAPFYLTEDECSTWLTWSTVKPNQEGDEIRMLLFKTNPNDIKDFKELKTGISAHIQHAMWAEQTSVTNPPTLGNLSRMELLVKQAINSQLRNVPQTVVNRIRNELREIGQRRKSRSPERRRHSPDKSQSPSPPVNQTQQIPFSNAVINPQQFYPQMMMPQQQFPQYVPPIQWNNGAAQGNQQPQNNNFQQRTNS